MTQLNSYVVQSINSGILFFKCKINFSYMQTQHCLWLVYRKNYSHLTKIFVLRQIKMTPNQNDCSRIEQKFAIIFLVVEKCKPCEIYRWMCYAYKEAYFSRGLVGLPLWELVEKSVDGLKKHWHSSKKNSSGCSGYLKGNAENLGSERPITIDFLEKKKNKQYLRTSNCGKIDDWYQIDKFVFDRNN